MKKFEIKNEEDYDTALDRVDELLDLKVEKNTELGNELEQLLVLINVYEDEHYPLTKN